MAEIRVSAADVKKIIATALVDDEIDAYILAAHQSVESTLAEEDVGEALKKEIERWLAAHFMATTRDQQLQQASAGPASATFQGKTAMGLNSTFYGQQVMVLDHTGAYRDMADGQKTKTARIESAGTTHG